MDFHGTKYGKFCLKAIKKIWNDLPEVRKTLTLVFDSSKVKLN